MVVTVVFVSEGVSLGVGNVLGSSREDGALSTTLFDGETLWSGPEDDGPSEPGSLAFTPSPDGSALARMAKP